jgi:hypothetical protein
MRIAGRDYILKISSEDNFESVFRKRKKYYSSGQPRELGQNSLLYFAMKDPQQRDYVLVGDSKLAFAGPLFVRSRDERNFSEEHNWRFVIDLTDLREYPERVPASHVFSPEVTKKLPTQRPFGIELTPQDGRKAKEKLAEVLKTRLIGNLLS